jgi:hypothetical protein
MPDEFWFEGSVHVVDVTHLGDLCKRCAANAAARGEDPKCDGCEYAYK